MTHYWTTQEGDEIPFNKLTDTHLINILKWIKKKSEIGFLREWGGGGSPEDYWHDSEWYEGQQVLDYFKFKELQEELLKRKNNDK